MDNVLRIIGLCKKAGQLQAGDEPAAAAARGGRARLILLAQDAAGNTVRRAVRLSATGHTPCLTIPCTKEQLGAALGRSVCAVAAVTDAGLAATIARKLAERAPAEFGEAADALERKAQKIQTRRREQAVHEKNVKRGKTRRPPGDEPAPAPNPNGGVSY